MNIRKKLENDPFGKAMADALYCFSFDIVNVVNEYHGGRYISFIDNYDCQKDLVAQKQLEFPLCLSSYFFATTFIEHGHFRALEFLVTHSYVNLSAPNSISPSLLITSIRYRQRGITFYLLDCPGIEKSIQYDVQRSGFFKGSNKDALREAMEVGDAEIVQKLLDKKANTSCTNELESASFFATNSSKVGSDIKEIISRHDQKEAEIFKAFIFLRNELETVFGKITEYSNPHLLRAHGLLEAFHQCQTIEELGLVIQIQREIFSGQNPTVQLSDKILDPQWADPANLEKGFFSSYANKRFLNALRKAETIMKTEIRLCNKITSP